MVEIRTVEESDLDAFCRVYNSTIGRDESLATIEADYSDHPEFLVGAYEGETLVGFAYGVDGDHSGVELKGIGVVEGRRREGIGASLLAALESAVVASGFERLGLGSAGGYVDEFYLACGYEPESILLRFDSEADAESYRDCGYDICRERVDDGVVKWYIDVEEHDPPFLDEVREAFDDPEAIYIMEKYLTADQ